ncbi:MAG: cytochrome c peroxidase, partial [Kangiellaceae bacterium]
LNCTDAFPDAYANSIAVAQHLQQSQNGTVAATSPLIPAQINQQQVLQIVAFLQALTDPCVTDSNCLSPWKLDSNDAASFPDDMLLLAVDENDIEQ